MIAEVGIDLLTACFLRTISSSYDVRSRLRTCSEPEVYTEEIGKSSVRSIACDEEDDDDDDDDEEEAAVCVACAWRGGMGGGYWPSDEVDADPLSGE